MALQGNLSDLPLIDLGQVLSLQGRSGILSVSRDFSQAQVWFNSSKIFAAFVHHVQPKGQMINRQGEEALYDLLSWQDGQFVFELAGSLPSGQNVYKGWDQIILEYCRRQDELEQSEANMAALCPHLALNPPSQAEILLSLEEWQILLQVNGDRNLGQVASNLRKPLELIHRVVCKLELEGLLEGLSRPLPYPDQTIIKVERQGERIVYQTLPPAQPALRWSPPALTPAVAGGPTFSSRPATATPKVGRGLLSGIMAKIRGL